MAKYQQLFSEAERQQALADQLTQRAMQPRVPQQQGRIASAYSIGEGLGQIGEALIARRAGKKASAAMTQAEEAKRQAQAAALAGMSGRQDTSMGPPEPVNPYARGQEALEAGVDPTLVEAYMAQQAPDPAKSPFGVIDPSDFTPESLQKFAQTRTWSDLVPRNNMFGRYNPGDYTPESWALFQETGDPAGLKRFAPSRVVSTSGGGVAAVDPINNTSTPVITDESGAGAAAERARQVAAATAEGEASGGRTAKQPALDSLAYVVDQFYPALANTPTGGIMGVQGLIGGVTDYQDAQRFDNLREQLSTELRTVFRIPGEGTLSDQEQKQYGLQLPARNMDEANNKQILTDLVERAKLRLQTGGTGEGPPAPAVTSNRRFVFDPATGSWTEQ